MGADLNSLTATIGEPAFPAPVAGLVSGDLWLLTDVQDWIQREAGRPT